MTINRIYITLHGSNVRVTIVNSHQLCVEVYDFDEYRYGVKYPYEFVENTSLLGLVETTIRKER